VNFKENPSEAGKLNFILLLPRRMEG